MGKFSKRSKGNLVGVHPELVRVLNAAVIDSPVDFTITEGVRLTERQIKLYAQGRTTEGPIVTNVDGVARKSSHQAKIDGLGYAVDLYPYLDGKVWVNEIQVHGFLRVIADHIKATAKRLGVEITWGGDWKTLYDPPHFEIKI